MPESDAASVGARTEPSDDFRYEHVWRMIDRHVQIRLGLVRYYALAIGGLTSLAAWILDRYQEPGALLLLVLLAGFLVVWLLGLANERVNAIIDACLEAGKELEGGRGPYGKVKPGAGRGSFSVAFRWLYGVTGGLLFVLMAILGLQVPW